MLNTLIDASNFNCLLNRYQLLSPASRKMALGGLAPLDRIERLIVRSVIENTIDQLAIVGGTIQLSLPSHGHSSSQSHINASSRPLEELLLHENKVYQKVCTHGIWKAFVFICEIG